MSGTVVRAWLAGPLADDPPQLDSLLESVLCLHHGKASAGYDPGYKVDRSVPCPEPGSIPIPIAREWIGGQFVARCSAPILGDVAAQTVDHVAKRIESDRAVLLSPDDRRIITTTNSWTKSYRLPLRVRVVPWIAWVVEYDGQPSKLRRVLERVRNIGRKVAHGYGQVARWEVVKDVAPPAWWWAKSERGPVLMRHLPVCDALPENMLGARRGFGSCSSPYWHPDRFCERVEPC